MAICLTAPAFARATTVRFKLVVDYPLLEASLRHALGVDAGPSVVWGSVTSCRSLVLRDVRLGPAAERVKVTASGQGEVGIDLAAWCLFPLSWEGSLESHSRPAIGDDWQLRLTDVQSSLRDREGRSTFVARRLWSVLGDAVEAPLRDFRFDLTPPSEAARALIRLSAPADRAAPVLATLQTLRPAAATAGAEGVEVDVEMDVPEAPPAPTTPEPALTPEERGRWQAAIEDWDAFLVFVVKDLGVLGSQREIRNALLELLLDSRHTLVEVLAQGPTAGEDPVRRLFLDAWQRLRTVVRRAAEAGNLGDHALRYLAFLAAGDALAALDAAAPGLGLEISADGLRRLARVLEPALPGDPLAHTDEVDPVLQELFDFHQPDVTPPPPDAGTPATPPSTVPAPPPTEPPPSSWWWRSGVAHAAEPPPVAELGDIGRTLDRWVPPPEAVARYRDLLSRLLDLTARREAERSDVGASFRELYRHLIRATAWQESCWRQFVATAEGVTFLLSETDDVGLMQVNRRVWRGFFDVRKLEWDIVYNAGAGAEILAQLLDRYGAREAARNDGHAARACYSAYNGGPGAYARYRQRGGRARDRAVDRAFWEKFRITASGGELEQVPCS